MASFRELVPVYSRLSPDGRPTAVPTDFATNTGAFDPRVMSLLSPQAPSGLASRSVSTVPIDAATGLPVSVVAMRAQAAEAAEREAARLRAQLAQQTTAQPGAQRAITPGTQPAGTVAIPPGVTPQSVLAALRSFSPPSQAATAPVPHSRPLFTTAAIPGPNGYTIDNKDQSRLVDTPSPRLTFAGEAPVSPALAAIANVTLPPMPSSRPLEAEPAAGSYTVRAGDTLSAISRATGIPIQQLVAANGIADPNRIFAGQQLNLGGSRPAPISSASAPAALARVPIPTKAAAPQAKPAAKPPAKSAAFGSKGYSANSARAAMPWAF